MRGTEISIGWASHLKHSHLSSFACQNSSAKAAVRTHAEKEKRGRSKRGPPRSSELTLNKTTAPEFAVRHRSFWGRSVRPSGLSWSPGRITNSSPRNETCGDGAYLLPQVRASGSEHRSPPVGGRPVLGTAVWVRGHLVPPWVSLRWAALHPRTRSLGCGQSCVTNPIYRW